MKTRIRFLTLLSTVICKELQSKALATEEYSVEAGAVEFAAGEDEDGFDGGECCVRESESGRIDTFDDSLKKLVDEMFDVMYKDMEEMVSKKQMAKELAKLRREMLELLSKKQNGECQAIVVSNLSATNQKLDLDTSLLVPFKSDLDSSFITLEKYTEQLMVISEYMSRIEEVGTKGADNQSQTSTAVERTAAEEKAVKIQRLKSGFRICKPQGTFLWPNMVSNNNNKCNTITSMLSSSQTVHYCFVLLGCIVKKVVKKAQRWNRVYALKCHISHEVNHLHEGLKHETKRLCIIITNPLCKKRLRITSPEDFEGQLSPQARLQPPQATLEGQTTSTRPARRLVGPLGTLGSGWRGLLREREAWVMAVEERKGIGRLV
ncbi:hypothetical protein TEA_007251 [Camellia sinensis var. sinensis]|uniref:Uncharacterized protein n=1 Tax=Camellia sinensis var. sinensis TaxID=542762 RepID=A0A4S4ER68_CAMSN|nr:hypothetical protein TEA_007251 [Camellia sinensis var. sinensis]